MKTLSQTTDFYYKELHPTLTSLEKQRQQLKLRVFVIFIIYSALFAIIFSTVLPQIIINNDTLLFVGFGYFGIGAFLYKFLIKDYTQEFKEKVIKPLILHMDENLHYYPFSYVGQNFFNRSKIFTSTPDKYNGNDHVKGSIHGVSMEFSDIHAQKRNKNAKGKESVSTIFQGMFIVAEFNKNFKGETVILPDIAQNSFGDLIGSWLQSYNFSRDELVKMDDPQFESEFVVYSTDQIEARYILSHSFMKRLLNFKLKSKHPIYISFVQNAIHIAVEYNKDLFEPSIFHSLLEYKIAMEYVQTLHLAISIINELNLNQKLWSKR